MTLKKFVALSVAVHLILLFVAYRIPRQERKKEEKPLTTTLVTPEVVLPPPIRPRPQAKTLPPAPARRLPSPETAPKRTLPERIVPHEPPPRPGERPAKPGEERAKGRFLPEDVKPGGPGSGGTTGDTRGGSSAKRTPEGPGLLGKKELFDRGVTEEIARRDSGGQRGTGKKTDDAVTFDTNEYQFRGYMNLLKGKIESIWVYPPEEAAAGHYGDLKIRFTIKKDGNLGAVELVRTSGNPALDRAALKALKDGEPYWPLPDSWGMDSYTILGHFVYSLYGAHVR